MGMDVSLFQRLSVCWPTDVIRLRQQYRMCGPLNALANKLAYAGDLLCANPQVEAATLPAPRSLSDGAIPTWLANIVKAGLDHAILFVDTSLLPFKGISAYGQRNALTVFISCTVAQAKSTTSSGAMAAPSTYWKPT